MAERRPAVAPSPFYCRGRFGGRVPGRRYGQMVANPGRGAVPDARKEPGRGGGIPLQRPGQSRRLAGPSRYSGGPVSPVRAGLLGPQRFCGRLRACRGGDDLSDDGPAERSPNRPGGGAGYREFVRVLLQVPRDIDGHPVRPDVLDRLLLRAAPSERRLVLGRGRRRIGCRGHGGAHTRTARHWRTGRRNRQ